MIPQDPWTYEECQALVDRYGGFKPAAEAIGMAYETFRSRCYRVGVRSPLKPGQTRRALAHAEESPEPEELSREELIRQEAERQRTAQMKLAAKRELRERSSLQVVLDTLREIIPPLVRQNIDLINVPVGTGDEEEAVALISDQQIGEVVDPVEMGGLGAFSTQVFQRRVERWTRSVAKIIRLHQHAYPVRRLHAWFLGDNGDGVLIYRGQSWALDADRLEQLALGTQAFARALVSLLQVVEQIRVVGLIGNHGRQGRKGEARLMDNTDILFYWILSLLLANYRDRITWDVPRSWWTVQEVLGHRFLLIHGDEINSSQTYGIPFYGVQRKDAGYTKMLQARGITYDYMIVGHHHHAAMMDSPTGEQIVNGSWVGGNELSARAKTLTNEPSQWLFGVHRRRGITWRYKIKLYEPGDEELVPARARWPVFGEVLEA